MNDELPVAMIVGVIIFIILSLITVCVQLNFWDYWDRDIINKLEAKKIKCEDIIVKNNQSYKDFINYERKADDDRSFVISEDCYKIINDFEFYKEYKLKKSYTLRYIFPYCMCFIISFFVAIITGAAVYDW